MPRQGYLGLALLLVGSASCSGSRNARDAGSSVHSLVRVEVTYTRVAGQAAAAPDTQALFVRYHSSDQIGLPKLLGISADAEDFPLGRCRLLDETVAFDEALAPDDPATPSDVSLLDAGEVAIKGPAEKLSLVRHHYELPPLISGVVYGGEESSPLTLGLGQSYQVLGEGGEEVGVIQSSVTAPRAFPTLTIEQPFRGSDLQVHWADPASEPASVEPLLLEIKASSRAGTRLTCRCRVRDSGSFAVPRDQLEGLPSAAQLASATVSATRSRRAPLNAPGAGLGEFKISLREVAELKVAP